MPPTRVRACLLALLLLPLGAPLAHGQDLDEVVEPPMPDLIGGSLVVEPDDPHEAAPLRLCADVRNIGSSNVTTPFYVSFFVDGVDEASLQVRDPVRQGSGVRVCTELTIASGPHQFTVLVDSRGHSGGGDVAESNETNNQPPLRHFHVDGKPRPNLRVVDALVTPSPSRTGQRQIFYFTIDNNGTAPSPPSAINISDETGLIARWPVPALAPGETFEYPIITNPDLRRPGQFTARFFVDRENAVPEMWHETADNHREVEYVVSEHPTPDLVVDVAEINGTRVENQPLRLDLQVRNLGDKTSPGGILTLTSTNETGANRTLGNRTFQRIDPALGENLSIHFSLGPGNHTLRLVVDPQERILERNETNNVWSGDITILAGERVELLPDLRVEALDAAPDDPAPGEVVTLTALVGNTGRVRAEDIAVEFRVDGAPVGVATIARLEPFRTMTVSVPWTPEARRDHALTAIADPEEAIEEYVESDNAFAHVVTIREPPGAAAPPADEDDAPTPPSTPPPDAAPDAPEAPEDDDVVLQLAPVEVADLRVKTRQEPGRLLGDIDVTVRNPNLDAVTGLTVRYLVDGQSFKEVLLPSLGPAATRTLSSGEVELPEGQHTVRVEVRRVGTNDPPASAESTYDEQKGDRGIPAPGLALALLAAAVGAGVRRGRPRR